MAQPNQVQHHKKMGLNAEESNIGNYPEYLWESVETKKIPLYKVEPCSIIEGLPLTTALGVPYPHFEYLYERGSVRSEEELNQVLQLRLPEGLKDELKRRFEAYQEAVKRKESLLLPLLQEITSDPSAQWDEDFRDSCSKYIEYDFMSGHLDLVLRHRSLFGFEEEKNDEKIRKEVDFHRELSREQILEDYWKPRTPEEVLRFYPDGDSMAGFLGWGEKLEEVIEDDRKVVEGLGHTYEEISFKLREVLKGKNEDYTVKMTHGFYGYQNCPFEGCEFNRKKTCPHGNANYVITNTKSGKRVGLPGMIWHLIGAHEFFEGKETSYRVDPKQLIEVLFG